MPSAFGRKKPVVHHNGQAQMLAWMPRAKTSDPQATQETVQAFYRITLTEPSRLERARMTRGHRLSA
jgi:hypothetical protein